MEQPDWSRFELRIPIFAPAEKLFDAWATPAGLESWFLRLAEFTDPQGNKRNPASRAAQGDVYRWLWFGWPDDMVESGEVLSVEAPHRFSFRFGKAGNCHISISPNDDNTMVSLLQDRIPDDELGRFNWHVGCKTGWTFYLANLKSIAEGGPDLRNKELKYQGVLNS